ncbi:haeIIIM [Symbiodinium sp. CCMP2592]|nr:haeIIIM [Symbiodinium sp. CCMP2592]
MASAQTSRAVSLEHMLYKLGGPFRLLSRPLRVCEPCIGIGGLRRLILACGGQYEATAGYDSDIALAAFYRSLQKHEPSAAGDTLAKVHIGPLQGDILSLSLLEMETCEALVGGPPCQPWSASGEKAGCQDPRADVMDQTITMVIEQAWRGQLCIVVLENSSLLLTSPFLAEIMRRLEISVPFFHWEVCKSDLSRIFPQSRERCWLRGMRRDAMLASKLPAPLQMEDLGGYVPLQSLLDTGVQPFNPIKLSKNQQCNLVAYMEQVRIDAAKGAAGQIALFELDRCPLKAFGEKLMYDRCMALRTTGPPIFMVVTSEVDKHWSEHTLHRFLSLEERCKIQGHEGSLALHFPTKAALLRGTGNAFHPLHLASMLMPMVREAYLTGVLSPAGPNSLSDQQLLELLPGAEELLAGSLCSATEALNICHKTPQQFGLDGGRSQTPATTPGEKTSQQFGLRPGRSQTPATTPVKKTSQQFGLRQGRSQTPTTRRRKKTSQQFGLDGGRSETSATPGEKTSQQFGLDGGRSETSATPGEKTSQQFGLDGGRSETSATPGEKTSQQFGQDGGRSDPLEELFFSDGEAFSEFVKTPPKTVPRTSNIRTRLRGKQSPAATVVVGAKPAQTWPAEFLRKQPSRILVLDLATPQKGAKRRRDS